MKPVWWDALFALLDWRMKNGWYYGWQYGYNDSIDWSNHPGKACP